jgi:hypothetical protein
MNYLETAKRRFPGHCVGGSGRYALYAPAAGPLSKILLFDSYTDAVRQIVEPRSVQIVDLAVDGEALLEKIPDLYDADERRRERREQHRG